MGDTLQQSDIQTRLGPGLRGNDQLRKSREDLLRDLAVFWGGTVTKPPPYSNSTHFSDHFGYHIAFPLLSCDSQAHVRPNEQPLHSYTHDQELAHMTVSLIT